ncbi:hypothetical protein BCR34DRAFT_157190 [Clohesyomyces aquaticus]|uniref:Inner kinetochore subunit AME1 domain-containing protein n=1 Tax=Clohesyomyces aquaticus TaxID=1231657 RepID=A0A1Y1YJB4_9PLEO|nr:hypothetical protein BCR34DRAFT_157190 [Clohesyomyces aquaticus]
MASTAAQLRQEKRISRQRGAGNAAPVQGTFSFTIPARRAPSRPRSSSRGTPQPRPGNRSSAPPSSRSRRTPTASNSRRVDGSASRRRSTSIPRSNTSTSHKTPRGSAREDLVTPVGGKRKRGALQTLSEQGDDDEADQLSPEFDDPKLGSVEKSRRVAATVSPIQEEVDYAPDELSFVENRVEAMSNIHKPRDDLSQITPVSRATKASASSGAPERTPIAESSGSMSISRSAISHSRKAKSTEPPPVTPAVRDRGRPKRHSSGPATQSSLRTTSLADVPSPEESEDELTPEQPKTAVGPSTARLLKPLVAGGVDDEADLSQDELSPPQARNGIRKSHVINGDNDRSEGHLPEPSKPAVSTSKKRDRDRKLEQVALPTATKLSKASANLATPSVRQRSPRNRRIVDEEDMTESMQHSTVEDHRQRSTETEDLDEEDLDELSPEVAPRAKGRAGPVPEVHNISSGEEESDVYSESEPEEENAATPIPRPAPAPREPASLPVSSKAKVTKKAADKAKATQDEPPRKRQKHGPYETIEVMRTKGARSKGVNVVDSTKKILDTQILRIIGQQYARVNLAAENNNRDKEKQLKKHVMPTVKFREHVEEHLLFLQDVHHSLSTSAINVKRFQKQKLDARLEFLEIQKEREQIAWKMDHMREDYLHEKGNWDAENDLSAAMFDIQEAIRSGRKRAREAGREDEGPDIPLKMMLEDLAHGIGSSHGFLGAVRSFNGDLERAAGFLEGRA